MTLPVSARKKSYVNVRTLTKWIFYHWNISEKSIVQLHLDAVESPLGPFLYVLTDRQTDMLRHIFSPMASHTNLYKKTNIHIHKSYISTTCKNSFNLSLNCLIERNSFSSSEIAKAPYERIYLLNYLLTDRDLLQFMTDVTDELVKLKQF